MHINLIISNLRACCHRFWSSRGTCWYRRSCTQTFHQISPERSPRPTPAITNMYIFHFWLWLFALCLVNEKSGRNYNYFRSSHEKLDFPVVPIPGWGSLRFNEEASFNVLGVPENRAELVFYFMFNSSMRFDHNSPWRSLYNSLVIDQSQII